MARKCSSCGSADVSTGLQEVTCLSCGAETKITASEGPGTRVPNPDGPAFYPSQAGEPQPPLKSATKAAAKKSA